MKKNETKPVDVATTPAAEKPKRVMDERVRVLRTADKVNALPAADKSVAVARIADPEKFPDTLATAASILEEIAVIYRDASKLSPAGLATLRKLVS